MKRYIEQKYYPDPDFTIGVEFGSRTINIDNTRVKVQLWDTAGQEIFRSITRLYYRNTIGAVLVYDISNRKSFVSITQWIHDLRHNVTNSDMVIFLVGNKSDIQDERTVSYDEGKELAGKYKMYFTETSAKNNNNIDIIFDMMVCDILNKIKNKVIDIGNSLYGIKYSDSIIGDDIFLEKNKLVNKKEKCC
jgi:Ras-related protein Rab-2A